jgi:hypothetical protein
MFPHILEQLKAVYGNGAAADAFELLMTYRDSDLKKQEVRAVQDTGKFNTLPPSPEPGAAQ